MTQFVTRLDEGLADEVDALIEAGVVPSRSEAVRLGLRTLVEAQRRRRTGRQVVEGYRSQPQTNDETAGRDQANRALIAEEPW